MNELALDRFRMLGIGAPGIDAGAVLDWALAEAGVVPLDAEAVAQKQQAVLKETYASRYPRWRRTLFNLVTIVTATGLILGLIMLAIGILSKHYSAAPGAVTIAGSVMIFLMYATSTAPYYPDYAGRWSTWYIGRWCSGGGGVPPHAIDMAAQIAQILPAADFYVVAHTTNSDPFMKVMFCGAERYLAEWEEVPKYAAAPAPVLTPASI